jgi:hypothetical protein
VQRIAQGDASDSNDQTKRETRFSRYSCPPDTGFGLMLPATAASAIDARVASLAKIFWPSASFQRA